MLRVRHDVIGKTPANRNEFDPTEFLERVYGENMIVCDSNNLESNWRDQIKNCNESSEYNWERIQNMLNIENDFHAEDQDSECVLTDDVHLQDRDLPKRVLAFTTQKLLEELTKKSQNLCRWYI